MGVAGASTDPDFILLAGTAGLLAGAFSMAAGEYISVRSQRDIYEYQIQAERKKLAQSVADEEQELAQSYERKGLSRDAAAHVAQHLMSNPELALDAIVREKLGLSPRSLGSPWSAAIVSFLAFCAGAIVPIIPYIIAKSGGATFAVSAGVSGGALLVVGGSLALFSGRNMAWGALRMFLAGGAAAGVTYGVGRLIGAAIS
jgi:VIT1/CCC1 family predicted Fe2+/Mn2+ transporter